MIFGKYANSAVVGYVVHVNWVKFVNHSAKRFYILFGILSAYSVTERGMLNPIKAIADFLFPFFKFLSMYVVHVLNICSLGTCTFKIVMSS